MSENLSEYKGQKIMIRFDSAKCIHSRNCVLGNPQVFVANTQGNWIQPDAASPEEIVALAHSCPSGAISYERLDGAEQEQAPLVNVARVRENGPLAFHADMQITGSGDCYRATLCRCGASQNKPFCDGSHDKISFTATGEPAAVEFRALEQRDGTLSVVPLKDGPLHVKGNLELCSGTGKAINRSRETWLCRCGASQNKPYCDGSHRKAGVCS